MDLSPRARIGSLLSRSQGHARRAAVLLLTLFLVSGGAARLLAQTHVPVVLNIYQTKAGAVITEAAAKDAIKEASGLLKQAGIKLVVVKTNTVAVGGGGDDGSGGGTAGDAKLNLDELKAAQKFGGTELDGIAGKKGVKISFVDTPYTAAPTSPGASIHRNPTILVKDRGAAATTGETVAHELGHVFTLGPGHVIDGTNGIRADAGGHAPNGDGGTKNGNLMAPSNRRTGTNLTDDQIAEIKKRRDVHGHCEAQFKQNFPAVKCAQAFGRTAEFTSFFGGPPASSTAVLSESWLSAVGDANGNFSEIDAQITSAAILANGQFVSVQYTLGLDIDNNPSTGIGYAGTTGIDRIVHVMVSGTVGGTLTASGQVEDPVHHTFQPLPTPQVVIDEQFPDLDGVATNGSLSVLLAMPPSLLGLQAPQVPVVATGGSGSSITSQGYFVYDQQFAAHYPTLQTSGNGTPTPGQPYPFTVSGLLPGSPFTLYLDETEVFSGTLDGTGSFSGSFVFPSSLPINTYYFLTAQDQSGNFAGTLTCPQWSTLQLAQGAVARGGSLDLAVGGSRLSVPTRRGETAAQVIARVAAAIRSDPALAARGVGVEVEENGLKTTGALSAVTSRDAGLRPTRGSAR